MQHKTLITAHTGSHRTRHNSRRYLASVRAADFDAFEIDLRHRDGVIFLAHNPVKNYRKRVPLTAVFEMMQEKQGLRVNCDLKEGKGLIYEVIELAKQYGVEDRLIFTGWFDVEDIDKVRVGAVYLNDDFFWHNGYNIRTTPANMSKIKQCIDEMNNPHIRGLNVNYIRVTQALMDAAKEANLPLSIYTVNKPKIYKTFLENEVENITTMVPHDVMKMRTALNK